MERVLLLVDDEENITSALVRLLRRDGYLILRANGGEAGLELLAQNKVGVIISDQRMPGMTGVEFLGKVRELYPDTVRVILSGYTELNSVTDAINRGAVYKFLTKPWEDDLLRANVEEAFQRYEMKMENARLARELQKANQELLRVNHELELRVEEKTCEAVRNLNILQVSQEVLEHLPVAVVGIGDDGVIAIANRMAHRLFSAEGTRPLLGEAAGEVIPAELLDCIAGEKCSKFGEKQPYRLTNGKPADCWCCPMGESSPSKGAVLVINADV
ncbi:MAG: histidine kinase [Gallionellales bacterium GWA2_60_18]|nr:MAG: histidine kinase [Gallionellales bacterium GWA2_60_18]